MGLKTKIRSTFLYNLETKKRVLRVGCIVRFYFNFAKKIQNRRIFENPRYELKSSLSFNQSKSQTHKRLLEDAEIHL